MSLLSRWENRLVHLIPADRRHRRVLDEHAVCDALEVLPDEPALRERAAVFAALGDPNRLALLLCMHAVPDIERYRPCGRRRYERKHRQPGAATAALGWHRQRPTRRPTHPLSRRRRPRRCATPARSIPRQVSNPVSGDTPSPTFNVGSLNRGPRYEGSRGAAQRWTSPWGRSPRCYRRQHSPAGRWWQDLSAERSRGCPGRWHCAGTSRRRWDLRWSGRTA